MSSIEFLSELDHQISLFTGSTLTRESKTLENRRLNIINQNLVYAYYKIITDYFNVTISGDENFFTEDELRQVIDRLNNIMKTYLYTDFS